jgi:hypothetical protein
LKLKTLAAFLLLAAVASMAQAAPKPGPELKKLDYFVGSWTLDGTIGQGPWGAGGKFSSSETYEWMSGNFFLVGHGTFKLPPELGGEGSTTSFHGYDADKNSYTHDEFNSEGRHESNSGTLNADTWTWTGSQNYGGQPIQQRMTIKMLSPSSYSFKFEISLDGAEWLPFMEGKATKK